MQPALAMTEAQRQHLAHKMRLRRIQEAADRLHARRESPQRRIEIADHQPISTKIPVVACKNQVVIVGRDHVADADVVIERAFGTPTIRQIQRAVCSRFGIDQNDMISPRRQVAVVRPRQIAMYLAKTLTPKSYPEIGRRFGGRDHTTVLHARRKIEELIETDEALAADVRELTAELRVAS